MIIKGISIRLKLLITTLITIALLMALSLVILDASNQLSLTRELMSEQSGMTSRFHSLEQTYDLLVENQDHHMIASCIKETLDLEMLISKIADYSINAEEEHLTLKARQISSAIQHLVDELSALPQNDSARILQLETEFLVLANLVNDFDSALYIREKSLIGDHRAKLTISLTLGIFFSGLFLILFSQNLSRSFFALTGFTDKLQKGALPPPLDLPPGDEMGQIAADLNKHISDLQSKIRYIKSLANEDSTPIYRPDEKDEIGNALVVFGNIS